MAYITEMYFLLFQRLEVQDQDVTELISLEASLLALHVAAFSLCLHRVFPLAPSSLAQVSRHKLGSVAKGLMMPETEESTFLNTTKIIVALSDCLSQ